MEKPSPKERLRPIGGAETKSLLSRSGTKFRSQRVKTHVSRSPPTKGTALVPSPPRWQRAVPLVGFSGCGSPEALAVAVLDSLLGLSRIAAILSPGKP